jgi:hypothetical protein
MQDVQDAGCNAIVEWFMISTPVKHLAVALDDALQFHLVQLHLATAYLHESQVQSLGEVESQQVLSRMPDLILRFQ